MLSSVLENSEFNELMKRHLYECMSFLLDGHYNFSIMVNLKSVTFTPPLPDEIMSKFKQPVIVFALEGYTYESVKLTTQRIEFEAGFGDEMIATTLDIPLGGIVQIIVENSTIMLNFSVNKKGKKEGAKNAFLSNPDNLGVIKKK